VTNRKRARVKRAQNKAGGKDGERVKKGVAAEGDDVHTRGKRVKPKLRHLEGTVCFAPEKDGACVLRGETIQNGDF